jgi:hypothetical protein
LCLTVHVVGFVELQGLTVLQLPPQPLTAPTNFSFALQVTLTHVGHFL